MMTVAAAFMGLLPIMWSTGAGADVMKRVAAPMVGGLVTSFLLELLVYPAIYALWKWRSEVRHMAEAAPLRKAQICANGQRAAAMLGAASARLPRRLPDRTRVPPDCSRAWTRIRRVHEPASSKLVESSVGCRELL